MPVNAEYIKIIGTIYPIDPRGQLISSRCDSALYWGNPSISSSASCDLALNTTDFAILLVGAVIVNLLASRFQSGEFEVEERRISYRSFEFAGA